MSLRLVRGLVWFVCLLGAWLSARPAAADASVETSVSAEQVEVGQSLRLRIRGQSDEGGLENPRLQVPPGFVVEGPSVGTQQQITIVNGKMERSVSTTATWSLTPTKVGRFRVGPGSFDDHGKTVKGGVVEIEVVAEGTLRRPNRRRSRFPFDDDPFGGFGSGGSLFDQLFPSEPRQLAPPAPPEYQVPTAPDSTAFLRATIEPSAPVVGQQVTLRVYAYGSQGPFAEGPAKESRHPDFFAIPIVSSSMKQQHYAVDIGGRSFLGLKVREIAMFPLKAGELSIGAMTMSFYGQRYATRQKPEGLERSTQPLLVQVREPPAAGRPPGYQLGDVGDFTLEAKVSPERVEAGGAVSVVATLKGKGRLPAALSLPEQKGVEWLEPSLTGEAKAGPDGIIAGSRTFTYVVRLTNPGNVDLGELTLPYYSPTRGRYDVARARLGVVQVSPNKQQAAEPEKKQKLTDQLMLRRELAGTTPATRAWYERAWYYPGLLVPPGLVLLFRASWRAFEGARNRRSQKQSDPRSLAREALKLASRELAQGRRVEALSAIERALFLALEAATRVKARAVLLSELERVLTRSGLAADDAKDAVALLEECQALRFGEAKSTPEAVLGRAKDCVQSLAKKRAPAPKG